MHHKYTEIDLDKSVQVRFKVIEQNSLTLYFKFKNSDGEVIDVSNIQFEFTVTDKAMTTELLKVVNADWTRSVIGEIKYVVNNLDIEPDEYNVDFTCTYTDGRVQTLMDGEFNVRERYII